MVAFLQKKMFLTVMSCQIASKPNSTVLNLVDYSILGTLQQLAYCQKVLNVVHLKEIMNSSWVISAKNESMKMVNNSLNNCCWSFIEDHYLLMEMQ